MTISFEGRVAIVTGAGGGLGRAHALELARQGACVVVNDVGATLDGQGRSESPARTVVDEITDAGGAAVADATDITDWDAASRLIQFAVETFGRLDVVVNNAGVLRDRMFANSTAAEWQAVVNVHLLGHAAVARQAAAHWRDRAKAGDAVDARIVNTTSGAGVLGSVGQAAYSAAKAGILGLTLVQAAELGRYGVTANAIAPAARTRMTEAAFAETMAPPSDGGFDAMAPENVSPLVAWLASPGSRDVTGRVFEVEAGKVVVLEGWRQGPQADKGARWEPAELGPVVCDLVARAEAPLPVYGAG